MTAYQKETNNKGRYRSSRHGGEMLQINRQPCFCTETKLRSPASRRLVKESRKFLFYYHKESVVCKNMGRPASAVGESLALGV